MKNKSPFVVTAIATGALLMFGCSTQQAWHYIDKPADAYAASQVDVSGVSSEMAKTAASSITEGATSATVETASAIARNTEQSVSATAAAAEGAQETVLETAEAAAAVGESSADNRITIEVPSKAALDAAAAVEEAAAEETIDLSAATSGAPAVPDVSIPTIPSITTIPEGAIDVGTDPIVSTAVADVPAPVNILPVSPAPIVIPPPAVTKAPKPAVAVSPAVPKSANDTAPPTSPTATPSPNNQKMNAFAELDGKTVTEYTLKNANGCQLKVLDYGCIVTSLTVPGRDGNMVDVALGHDNLTSYQEDSPYFGAMVGRCGNRIANATFSLDGKDYALAANNGDHSLHGGVKGFDKKIWKAQMNGDNEITFTLNSPDGDEGFPGALTVRTTYKLTDNNEFNIVTRATTDAPTICNVVHHSYWNLEGHDAGKIYDHELQLFAAKYTPGDETLIPTGKIAPVAGTALDFTSPKKIGKDLQAVGGDPVGYDHNFVVDGRPRKLRPVAKVVAPKSGVVMEIEANQPGVQFYTGNFMEGHKGKNNADYQQHEGFCLETQFYPDSANKQGVEGWPSVVLRPGDTYTHRMNHKFSVAN